MVARPFIHYRIVEKLGERGMGEAYPPSKTPAHTQFLWVDFSPNI